MIIYRQPKTAASDGDINDAVLMRSSVVGSRGTIVDLSEDYDACLRGNTAYRRNQQEKPLCSRISHYFFKCDTFYIFLDQKRKKNEREPSMLY